MRNIHQNLQHLWDGLRGPGAGAVPRDNDEDGSSPTLDKQTMLLQEAGRAARAWVVVYVVLFLCLLGYRWQTKGYYEAEYERRLEAARFQNTSQLDERPWWEEKEAILEESLESMKDLLQREAAELEALSKQQALLQQMYQSLDQLDFSKSSTSSGKAEVSVNNVNNLLQKPELSEMHTSEALQRSFSQAIEDLKNIVQSESVDWSSIDSLFAGGLPEKLPTRTEEGAVVACPKSTKQKVSVPQHTARQSDLEEQIQSILALHSRRENFGGGFDFLLPETLEEVERAAKRRINTVLDALAKSLPDGISQHPKKGSSRCITEQEILHIVDEGLLALQNHADLRNILRKKVLELDPTTKSVILDADLPLPQPRIPARESKNLMHIIDRPIMSHLARGIDYLVEFAGGYNDRFDLWLDSFVGGEESVGEAAVRRLLDKSGTVEIPNIGILGDRYLPAQIRDLKKKLT